jgi:hypothetical protein
MRDRGHPDFTKLLILFELSISVNAASSGVFVHCLGFPCFLRKTAVPECKHVEKGHFGRIEAEEQGSARLKYAILHKIQELQKYLV